MHRRGFTLAEVMVAMLFVSIALFGYVALHLRILHSSSTLQLRHSIRRKVDLHMGIFLGQARNGQLPAADGTYPLLINDPNQEFITPYLVPTGDQPGNNYDGHKLIQTQSDNPVVRHLTLQIDWRNQHGAQSYVLDTFHAPKDKGW
ncbi:MAG: prepilin-type N-terminal cleavage/methylation domain-containing protein [Vulcanimicrobiota bacterium]